MRWSQAPFGLFFLLTLTLGGAVALWRGEATPARAARSGFLFGFGLFLAGVSWIYVSLPLSTGIMLLFLMPRTLALLRQVAAKEQPEHASPETEQR